MKLKLFIPTTSIAGGLFMLKRTIKETDSGGIPKSVYDIVSIYLAQDYGCSSFFEMGSAEI